MKKFFFFIFKHKKNIKNGLNIDYFLKKKLNYFLKNTLIWFSLFFLEKYIIEFLPKNIIPSSFLFNFKANSLKTTNLTIVFLVISQTFLLFFIL